MIKPSDIILFLISSIMACFVLGLVIKMIAHDIKADKENG